MSHPNYAKEIPAVFAGVFPPVLVINQEIDARTAFDEATLQLCYAEGLIGALSASHDLDSGFPLSPSVITTNIHAVQKQIQHALALIRYVHRTAPGFMPVDSVNTTLKHLTQADSVAALFMASCDDIEGFSLVPAIIANCLWTLETLVGQSIEAARAAPFGCRVVSVPIKKA